MKPPNDVKPYTRALHGQKFYGPARRRFGPARPGPA